MSHSTPMGYKSRPLELYIIPIIFLLVPVINFVGWIIYYTMALGKPFSLPEILSLNMTSETLIGTIRVVVILALWAGFVLSAVGVFLVRRWGFFLCIVVASVNVIFNLFTYHRWMEAGVPQEALIFNFLQPSNLINLLFFLPVFVILQKDIMAPFFNPRLKWWEQHKRVKKSLKIEAQVGGRLESFQSFDISAIGMFLATSKIPAIRTGDTFPAVIHLEDLDKKIDVHCKAVWISGGSNNYPPGIGCSFTDMKSDAKKILGDYIKKNIRQGEVHDR